MLLDESGQAHLNHPPGGVDSALLGSLGVVRVALAARCARRGFPGKSLGPKRIWSLVVDSGAVPGMNYELYELKRLGYFSLTSVARCAKAGYTDKGGPSPLVVISEK